MNSGGLTREKLLEMAAVPRADAIRAQACPMPQRGGGAHARREQDPANFCGMRPAARMACRHEAQGQANVHFVGIGGAGMSGIAEVLLNLGYRSAARICRQCRDPAPAGARRRHSPHRSRREPCGRGRCRRRLHCG
jgi:hypothetical protein